MDDLEKLAKLIRYYSLVSTTNAGSGHLNSSLSATDIMTTLFFGGFLKFDTKNPDYLENDRVIVRYHQCGNQAASATPAPPQS